MCTYVYKQRRLMHFANKSKLERICVVAPALAATGPVQRPYLITSAVTRPPAFLMYSASPKWRPNCTPQAALNGQENSSDDIVDSETRIAIEKIQ